ncbi:4-hydroxythreonine-4-phosphate dehydrogenase PdxA [Halodesulfovibrio marinisediminis]|uniref:4-hydroxythreonine-4-phosphate dehydrogenase n=1 Tax=Halodesulfovibrio marinisediminis DSM 17456 TaxID=1121457 RepID=A0A1N6DRA4_9BACT|nr:4-hydroxythreonine-4-phosphate dehydrogenase PdxA [Halodesulfovibrio marinisediminis]SIN73306.1 4-hydroxythreonine-4-phosphate dehydrogenase [Halodesulfovibrio marinisediminis DSM 17456]
MPKKTLLITLGDANGLGPELACRLFGEDIFIAAKRPIIMIGSAASLLAHTERLNMDPFWETVESPREVASKAYGVYLYEPASIRDVPVTVGEATKEGGFIAGESLQAACQCITDGIATGMVTLPLHKAMLQEAGFDFPGHTEFLARYAGLSDDEVCMHLCGEILRVSLVTTHPALRDVADMITEERLLRTFRLTDEFMKQIGQGDRPIAVCGLNPHAGESGKIGTEDQEIVAPAVRKAQEMGMNVDGPFPADTLFHKAARGVYSSVVAMYHDQGLAPLKLLHFSEAVNVTLGLPFVRTSVDHGTGFDIVGKDIAHTNSFREAIRLAILMLEGDEL